LTEDGEDASPVKKASTKDFSKDVPAEFDQKIRSYAKKNYGSLGDKAVADHVRTMEENYVKKFGKKPVAKPVDKKASPSDKKVAEDLNKDVPAEVD
jgi:hypothetical protein